LQVWEKIGLAIILLIILSGCTQQANSNNSTNNAANLNQCNTKVSDLTNIFTEKGIDIYAVDAYLSDKVKKISDTDLTAITDQLSALKLKCASDDKISSIAEIYSLLADELKVRKKLIVKSAEMDAAIEKDPCDVLSFKDDVLALHAELNSTVSLKENKIKYLIEQYAADAEISSLKLDNLGGLKYAINKNFNNLNAYFNSLEEVCK